MDIELSCPCHFGLESPLKREIKSLGYEISSVTDGRVSFISDTAGICRANIFLRTAERVLLKAAEFEAYSWEELFDRTYDVPWEELIPADGRVWVAKASSVRSKLFSPRDFQTIIQKAVVRRLQESYGLGDTLLGMTGALFALRVSALNDRITIYIDTSGESLHKRGYRRLTSQAPISETLAAALIMLTPFKNGRILIDPFCGSGTFPIEAAMAAADIAPGIRRNFAAADWTELIERRLWHEAYDEARERASRGINDLKSTTEIIGCDIDPGMIRVAAANAAAAGVDRLIRFKEQDISRLSHPGRYGIILTNPPYGERMETRDTLPELYKALGERTRAQRDFSLYVISAYDGLEQAVGMKAARNRKIYNGMLKTYFYSFPGAKPGPGELNPPAKSWADELSSVEEPAADEGRPSGETPGGRGRFPQINTEL